MNFFSVQRNFEANLYSTYVVKVSLEGITILGQRDWTIKKVRETALKVKCPLTDIPKAYELRARIFGIPILRFPNPGALGFLLQKVQKRKSQKTQNPEYWD